MLRFQTVPWVFKSGMRSLQVLCLVHFICVSQAAGQSLKLRDICRVKGQETNTLQGIGLVVGLRGTGDGESLPKDRALARMMQLMGAPMSVDPQGRIDVAEVADTRNVALVFITAEVPAIGAQQGDRLDLTVNAISAKSLDGGYLLLAPLVGPNVRDSTVYAMASGPLAVERLGPATTAKIARGAKMESTIRVPFETDGKLTLVIDRDFADFDTSQRVEETINKTAENVFSGQGSDGSPGEGISAGFVAARAIDQVHVEVQIPPNYRQYPIVYISGIMEAPIALSARSNRVVINEREGIVIIGENVEIAPALVTQGNLRIEAVARVGPGFLPLDPASQGNENPKLKALADALNAFDVPTEDLIAIIKTLKKKGDLYGELIFE